jgi:transcriptional regulator of arginine metabolism
MINKYQRHSDIKDIIATGIINSQNELLDILIAKGHIITQATLSRDLKELKASKVPGDKGSYKYILADDFSEKKPLMSYGGYTMSGFISIEFSKNLGIIKTMPAFSPTIASAIDKAKMDEVLGTIAGDDTILIIAREGYTKYDVMSALKTKFPALNEKIR